MNDKIQLFFRSESGRRALIVLFFSVFPLLLPSFVFAAIYLFSDLDSHRTVGENTEYAAIAYPINGKTVPNEFIATGTLKDIPDNHTAYLSSSSDDLYWPKTRVNLGEWSLKLTATGDAGYKYNLSIIALPEDEKHIIENWFKNGRDTGKYPPLSGLKGLQVLATIKVKK